MTRYRRKPVEVEAMRWCGHEKCVTAAHRTAKNAKDIVAWVNANGGVARYEPEDIRFGGLHVEDHNARIAVRTINGWAYAAPGHYVVMGDATFNANENCPPPCGRFLRDLYPCDPETFDKRWEQVDD